MFKTVTIKVVTVSFRQCIFGSNRLEAMTTVHSFCGSVPVVRQMSLPQIEAVSAYFLTVPSSEGSKVKSNRRPATVKF